MSRLGRIFSLNFARQTHSWLGKALASFRSSVSKPSVNQPWDRSEELACLIPLVLVAPKPSEIPGGLKLNERAH